MEYPEMKSALQVYVQTNHSFIMEKLYSKFKTECVKDYQLKDLDLQKMVNITKQIFKFGENNDDMKTFTDRIEQNLEKFINEKYRTVDEIEDMFINTDLLLEAIKFCVDKGFDPNVKEQEIKEEVQQQIMQEVQQQVKEEKKVPLKKRIIVQKQQEKQKKIQRKFIVPKPKTPQVKNFIQKHEMPERKKPARYLNHIKKKPQQEKKQEPQIYVQPIDLSYLQRNKQKIEKRLKKLYVHYCSQQLNIGVHTTFDRIKSECTHMTLGKFMLFCKMTSLFKNQKISKDTLQAKFKQVAQGKLEIEFEQFRQILKQLDQKYIQIKKQTVPEEEIPTYEARLMLKNVQFQKMKVDIDFPFTTKEKQGRQLKQYKYNTLEIPSGRSYKSGQQTPNIHRKSLSLRQPTVHSGKLSKNLMEYLQTKKEATEEIKKSILFQKQKGSLKKQKIFRVNDLSHNNYPNMEWTITPDEDDYLIDSIFAKEPQKNVVDKTKKRVLEVEKIQKSMTRNY